MKTAILILIANLLGTTPDILEENWLKTRYGINYRLSQDCLGPFYQSMPILYVGNGCECVRGQTVPIKCQELTARDANGAPQSGPINRQGYWVQ